MSNRAAVTLAVVAVAVGLAVSGCRFEVNVGSLQITDDASVPGPVNAIQLAAGDGDIKVHTAPGSGVAIHRTIHYHGKTKPQPGQQVTNGVLTFVKGCSNCSVDYDLTAPSSARVQIRNGSGSIRVADVATADIQAGSGDITVWNVAGPVRAHTGSGSVRAESVGGQTDLHASSGDIIATGIQGGTLQADTGSGSIRLKFSGPPSSVRAVTGSGDVFIMLPDGEYRIDPSTGSGDQHIGIDSNPNAAATVFAKTGSGSIRIEPSD
ncbi:MAG TPA: DUF4097 family beta strand repeat-containing protein [Streptosporangiaceae bacterium]|jgi:hypothetical protein